MKDPVGRGVEVRPRREGGECRWRTQEEGV